MRFRGKLAKITFVASIIFLSAFTFDWFFGWPSIGTSGQFCANTGASNYSFQDEAGFLTVVYRHGGKPTVYDFVVRPGSQAHFTITYDYGSPELNAAYRIQKSYNYTLNYIFGSAVLSTVSKLDDGGILSSVPLNKTGIDVYPSNITALSASIIKVTYMMNTSASAGGTYVLGLFSTCPGEMLTVGYIPYMGPLPWGTLFTN
jgi:hypothetical protein